MKRLPIQPLDLDQNGVMRFRENKIVNFLLEFARSYGCDMNTLAVKDFPQEDREQFAQLIGYSISGFSELDYVSEDTYETAEKMAAGKSEVDARIEQLQQTVDAVRSHMKKVVPLIFRVHPDDLRE